MTAHADVHPTDELLAEFVWGKLPDPGGEVEAHLTHCPACQARAAEAAGDTFVRLLTAAGARAAAARAAAPTPVPASPSQCAATQAWDGRTGPAGGTVTPAGLAAHPRYRLVRPLGRGGMGDVWLAEHAVMGRPVALKVIGAAFLARPGAVERFRREVRAVAALHHPNIVTAFDADEADGVHFLVMEYAPGETLAAVVARGPLPAADACRAARDAARGLAHAHARGLVHRDVKPSNLIRAADGAVKVLDFGLVGAGTAAPGGLTGANVVMGTPDYIAPEQATDAHAADARSDVYALGCTLYHLLAGRVPYPHRSALEKLDAHRDPAQHPAALPDLPAGLAAVVWRMMAKDPNARYPSADAVADALAPYCDPARPSPFDSGRTEIAAAPADRERPRARRGWRVAALAALFALAAAGGVVYKMQRDNEEITVKADDPDIEVVMKRNGELVRIVDAKTKQAWELDTKKMRLKPDGGELTVDVPGEGLVLRRNGDAVVTVTRVPKPPHTTEPVKPIPPPVPDAALVRTFKGHTGTVRCVAYSPDGRYIVTGSGWPLSDQTVRLWEVSTGKQVWSANRGCACDSIAFCTKDTVLAAGYDGFMRLLDVRTGDTVRTFEHKTPFHALASSPDGSFALTAGGDRVIRVWDTATGKQIRAIPAAEGVFVFLAVSPNGRYFAGGSSNGTVCVWDVKTGDQLKLFQGEPHRIGHAGGFTPDGRHVVFGHSDRVIAWEWESDATRRFEKGAALGGGISTAVSPDGKRVLAGSTEGSLVGLWDFDSGKLLATYAGHTDMIWGVAFSPDGAFAVSASGDRTVDGKPRIGDDRTVRLWKLPDAPAPPKPIPPPVPDAALVRTFKGHTGSIRCVAYSPDGKQVLSASGWPTPDGTVRLWDAATGQAVWAAPLGQRFDAVAFASDEYVLAGGVDGTVRVLSRATGKEVRALRGHQDTVHSVALSPDGRSVVTSAADGTVRVWELKSGRQLVVFPSRGQQAYNAVFSPDGRTVASTHGDNTIRVWDVGVGREVRVYQGTTKSVGQGIGFTRDGRHVLFTAASGAMRWDPEKNEVVRLYPGGSGYSGGPLAVSPDGSRLLTGGGDAVLRLFDVDSGKLLQEFAGHADYIWWVAFSPDGKFALTGSGGRVREGRPAEPGGDYTLRLWKLPEPAAVKP